MPPKHSIKENHKTDSKSHAPNQSIPDTAYTQANDLKGIQFTTQNLLRLQQTIGNRVVFRMLHNVPRINVQGLYSPVSDQATPQAYDSNLLSNRSTIQRAFGMEFESKENKVKDRGSKDLVATGATGVKLEADTDEDIEFVTLPTTSKETLLEQVKNAHDIVKNLNRLGDKIRIRKGEDNINTQWKYADQEIEIKDDKFCASVQSTEGVKLENIPSLMQEHMNMENMENINKNIQNLQQNDTVKNRLQEEPIDENKVIGLISAIIMYIYRAQDLSSENIQGPKVFFTLMHRTDFHSMYDSLKSAAKISFNFAVFGQATLEDAPNDTPITKATGVKLDDRVFKTGYKDGDKEHEAGPTLRQWLNSILEGRNDLREKEHEKKDYMSPPSGWENHGAFTVARKRLRYGMGAYEMDGELALFEMRGYTSRLKNGILYNGKFGANEEGKIPVDQWITFATTVFDSALSAGRGNLQNIPEQQAPQFPMQQPLEPVSSVASSQEAQQAFQAAEQQANGEILTYNNTGSAGREHTQNPQENQAHVPVPSPGEVEQHQNSKKRKAAEITVEDVEEDEDESIIGIDDARTSSHDYGSAGREHAQNLQENQTHVPVQQAAVPAEAAADIGDRAAGFPSEPIFHMEDRDNDEVIFLSEQEAQEYRAGRGEDIHQVLPVHPAAHQGHQAGGGHGNQAQAPVQQPVVPAAPGQPVHPAAHQGHQAGGGHGNQAQAPAAPVQQGPRRGSRRRLRPGAHWLNEAGVGEEY